MKLITVAIAGTVLLGSIAGCGSHAVAQPVTPAPVVVVTTTPTVALGFVTDEDGTDGNGKVIKAAHATIHGAVTPECTTAVALYNKTSKDLFNLKSGSYDKAADASINMESQCDWQ